MSILFSYLIHNLPFCFYVFQFFSRDLMDGYKNKKSQNKNVKMIASRDNFDINTTTYKSPNIRDLFYSNK